LSEQDGIHPRSCCVPWALKYIQGILAENNIPVALCDLRVEGCSQARLFSLIRDFCPSHIVIQSNSLEYPACEDILGNIKSFSRAELILIGQYPTYCEKTPDFTVSFKGEPELAVPEYIITGNKGLVSQNKLNIVSELSGLPFPRYKKEELCRYYYPYPVKIKKKVTWGSLLATRGCPYDCIFCTQILRESYGKKVRFRHAGSVVEEVKYLKSLGADIISFEDDSFTLSSQYTESICDCLAGEKISLPWICQARVDELNFATLRKMKEAGCALIRFGVESGSARVLESLKKTENGQDWIRRAEEVFLWCQKLGIATDAMFIIGCPGETEEEIRMSMRLAKELHPDMLQVCIFTPYPGSAVYEEYKKDPAHLKGMSPYHYGNKFINLSKVSDNRLIALRKEFYRNVVFRPSFLLKHAFNYGCFYLLNFRKMSRVLDLRNFLNLN